MAERTNEEKLDLFADLLEPFAEIIADEEFIKQVQGNGKKILAVRTAIKNHKGAIIQILALIDGVPVEEYKVNLLALPFKVMDFLNRPEIADLFTGQVLKNGGASSGSATDNIKDGVA